MLKYIDWPKNNMKTILEYIINNHITANKDIPDVDLNNLSVVVQPNKPRLILDYLKVDYIIQTATKSKGYYVYLKINDLLDSNICKENACKCFLDIYKELFAKETQMPIAIKCSQGGYQIGMYYYTNNNSWRMNGDFNGKSVNHSEDMLKLIKRLNTSCAQ